MSSNTSSKRAPAAVIAAVVVLVGVGSLFALQSCAATPAPDPGAPPGPSTAPPSTATTPPTKATPIPLPPVT